MFKLMPLLLIVPLLGQAATISLSANCGSVAYTSNQPGSISCTGFVQYGLSAQAVASVNGFLDSVSVSGSGGGDGYGAASYSEFLQITITNGTGAGYYVPEISVGASGFAGGATAQFGSIQEQVYATLSGSMIPYPTALTPGDSLPFIFGVPQTQQVMLSAGGGGAGGSGTAYLSGITVYDTNGNVLSSAQVSVVETTPEPSLFIPLCAAMAAAFLVRRRITSAH